MKVSNATDNFYLEIDFYTFLAVYFFSQNNSFLQLHIIMIRRKRVANRKYLAGIFFYLYFDNKFTVNGKFSYCTNMQKKIYAIFFFLLLSTISFFNTLFVSFWFSNKTPWTLTTWYTFLLTKKKKKFEISIKMRQKKIINLNFWLK